MSKKINFYDTTFRDGSQSMWAMQMKYGMYDAVAAEMDQGGYSFIELPANAAYFKMAVRMFKEDPWETMRMFKRKMPNTRKSRGAGHVIDIFKPNESIHMLKLWHERLIEATGSDRVFTMANTKDELKRDFPTLIPMLKELGQTIYPAVCYTVSPRHTDEYFGNLTKEIMKYKPDGIKLKDAGGLLTPERARTLIPAIIANAEGVPVELHTHGMSTYGPATCVEAMQLGIDAIHTCVPPLAFGSSHASIFNVVHNAKLLGLETNINEAPLRIASERLLRIAKLENLPIGAPLEYDHGQYLHMVPGGVISNLRSQLGQLGIAHKLNEVLEEVPRIIKDLGYPMMITPHSQFIVSQAAVNVAVGERYKEILDCMIELAMGVYGVEDAGVPYMDQNVKDLFLSNPRAKEIEKKVAKKAALSKENATVEQVRQRLGMVNASDEEFLLYYLMDGGDEIKKVRTAGEPQSYYTGQEPLVLLFKELSKTKDISHLHLQRGDSVFDFHQKSN